jgi:hypothetical protein
VIFPQTADPKTVRQFLVEDVSGVQTVEGEPQTVLSSERNLG